MAKINKEQLAKLSKEEKLRLLDLIDQKKKKARERRAVFTPNEGQAPVMASRAKIRMVISANGAGKTAMATNEALWAAEGFNPVLNEHTAVPANVIVVLDAPAKVGDVWLPEFRKWYNLREEQMHKDGKPFISRLSFDNGSQIKFMFHLQEPLAFESLEASFVVFDEPPPRDVFVALLRAGRTKGKPARYLLVGTPISQPWLREMYMEWERGEHTDVSFFKASTEVNRANLAEGYIEDFSRHLTEREKRTRLHGDFFNTEGMALAELFDRATHVVPKRLVPTEAASWPAVLAIDPHPNKPTHAIVLAVNPEGRKFVLAETAQKMTARDFGNWLQGNWLHRFNFVDLVCDNYGSGEMTGGEGFRSFIEVLNSLGIRIRPTTYDEKQDDKFITRIQEVLYVPPGGVPLLAISGDCTGIVHDIENVQWKAQKGTEDYQPKLEIGNRDYLSCLKYALSTNLTYSNSARKIKQTTSREFQRSQFKRDRPGFMERSWQPRRRKNEDDW